MDEAKREEIVSALEDAARAVGAKSYDEGMATFKRLLESVCANFSTIETKDALRATLDSLLPLPKEVQEMLPQAARQLPQLLRYGFKMVSDSAASTLPAAGTGRPRAITPERSQEVLNSIGDLIKAGCSFSVAKDRTAQKLGVSRRTIQRICSKSATAPMNTVSISDIIRIVSGGDTDSSAEIKAAQEKLD